MNSSLSDRISGYIENAAEPVSADEAVRRVNGSHRNGTRVLLIAALAVFVILGGVAAIASQRGEQGGPASVTTEPTRFSTADKQRAMEESVAEFESGFARYPYTDPSTGETEQGYLATFSSPLSLAPMYDEENKRVPVFAERSINSDIVGYDYSWIGFVPVAVADSGSYDSRAVRISLYGCDPADEACAPTSYPATPDTLAP